VRTQLQNDLRAAEDAIGTAHDKAKHALSPTTSRQPREEEEEGWQSDREGETSTDAPRTGRRQSRSPKVKPPKLAVLRPAGGKTRRRSIRRGMLDSRTFDRAAPENVATSHDNTLAPSAEESESDEDERGRRTALSRSPAPLIGSGIGPRHARIDSLRSMESHSRFSIREASPARSIRWADTDGSVPPDGSSSHGRNSGHNTPGILSPVSPASPLPPDDAHSEHEHDAEHDSATVTPANSTQVRFSIPPTTGNKSP
jgi:sodium/hydrogen antiporter